MKLKDYIDVLIILIVIVVIRTFFITPAKVNGSSMDKTLHDKEIILVNKIDYSLNSADRFDIVVFQLDNGERLIKRVIGLGGETVKCKDNQLYINGKVLQSDIEFEYTSDFDEIEIPKGYFFVLGDNRDNSIDSRKIGPISEDNIIGTVSLVLFPFEDFGKVE